MGIDLIQAEYDQLENIAARFAKSAEDVADMHMRVERAMQALQNGGWEGEGSSAFFAEMNGTLFPAVMRLNQSLEQAQRVTLQVKDILQTAEEEAANPFREADSGDSRVDEGVSDDDNGRNKSPQPDSNAKESTPPRSIWDHFEFEGDGSIWSWDKREGGKFNPGIGIKYGFKDHALFGNPEEDGFSAIGGNAKAGLGYSAEDGLIAGLYGEYYTLQGKIDGVYGDSDLAITGGVTGKVLAADGFAGYKDGSIGASIGGTLVSVEGEAGVNVAGVNVGLKGEVGLKAELGFKIGKETELKLPFVTIGFTFGGAKE